LQGPESRQAEGSKIKVKKIISYFYFQPSALRFQPKFQGGTFLQIFLLHGC
jgi:hypothetical protein